jgi:hypothetical protein
MQFLASSGFEITEVVGHAAVIAVLGVGLGSTPVIEISEPNFRRGWEAAIR